jgi:hypothetical protein
MDTPPAGGNLRTCHPGGPFKYPSCHFQKPIALADPRIRLAQARLQPGSEERLFRSGLHVTYA